MFFTCNVTIEFGRISRFFTSSTCSLYFVICRNSPEAQLTISDLSFVQDFAISLDWQVSQFAHIHDVVVQYETVNISRSTKGRRMEDCWPLKSEHLRAIQWLLASCPAMYHESRRVIL